MGINPKGTTDYVNEVQKVLKQVAGDPVANPVSRVILQAISETEKDLTIVPLSKLGDGKATCQAAAASRDPSRATPAGVGRKGATGRGIWYDGSYDDPKTPRDERFTPVDSRGEAVGGGSDAKLYFTPSEYGKTGCDHGVYGSMPDEVLLHEMVHCLRRMQGVYNPVPTVNAGYTNEEEFLAIVVTNVYMSANNKTQLRADHAGSLPLAASQSTSEGFVANRENRELLRHYSIAWSGVFWELARLYKPVFNPFREFIEQRYGK